MSELHIDPSELGFDPDALRDKYRQERDKRIRPEGNEQYVEVTGKFAHFVDDPYVRRFERAPLHDAVDVVVIGGGFGGLLAGARLREAGINRVRIIEAGGDFGGTWYWNRYPGAQCDIESYCYLPLIEELGYMPKEKYSFAPEIYEHSQRIAHHYDLYDAACFQTQGDRAALGRRVGTLDRDDGPQRRNEGALRRDGDRTAESPEAAVDSRHRRFQRPHVPHQPLGLRLHRRRSQRRTDQTRGQTRRDHRYRRDGDPVRAVRRRIREAVCMCSNARRRRSTCAATSRPIRMGADR